MALCLVARAVGLEAALCDAVTASPAVTAPDDPASMRLDHSSSSHPRQSSAHTFIHSSLGWLVLVGAVVMPPNVMSTLPSCRPVVMKDLRGSLSVPAELAAKCAVVGSSDLLRLQPRGAEIVLRSCGDSTTAPTKGWEAAVGSRTDVRVVNHLPIEKWVKLAQSKRSQAHSRRRRV